jgi:hypothetical protein
MYFGANGIHEDSRYAFFEDRRDEQIYWLGSDHDWFALGGPGTNTEHDRLPIITERLSRAFEKAAAERFGT